MALEATHIRIAMDVKDAYQVSDIGKYICGTIYPDSRYVTKIERQWTHPRDFRSWDVRGLDDFKKGWFVHVLYDQVQGTVLREQFPFAYEGRIAQGNDVWVRQTALKALQEQEDLRAFDVRPFLPYLEYAEHPNGEDLDLVRRNNRTIQETYAHPDEPLDERYKTMWKASGVPDDVIERLMVRMRAYAKDPDVATKMKTVYAQTLDVMRG